jgi:hypothetical protein
MEIIEGKCITIKKSTALIKKYTSEFEKFVNSFA